jgi:putative tryptophan/tyrosine transport system substrate-binding protein
MRQGRRQLLSRGLGLLSALGVAGLLACKQPVPPEGRASATDRPNRTVAIVPTPTYDPDRPRRVGLLGLGYLGVQHDRMRDLLRKRGHIVDWRHEYLVDADDGQLRTLASRLLARDVEVIVANGPTSALAATQVTQRVPIVMEIGTYPDVIGLVPNLTRPGGNVTGVTLAFDVLVTRRLALLRELMPSLARLGVLTNPAGSTSALAWRDILGAALSAGLHAQQVQARSVAEIDAAFVTALAGGADAVWVIDDELFDVARQPIIFAAERRKLPVLYGRREFVEEGGLMSFGPDVEHAGQLGGSLVDRILQGYAPGSLSFEVIDRFETAINQNVAGALGLTFPSSIVSQATRIVSIWP